MLIYTKECGNCNFNIEYDISKDFLVYTEHRNIDMEIRYTHIPLHIKIYSQDIALIWYSHYFLFETFLFLFFFSCNFFAPDIFQITSSRIIAFSIRNTRKYK